MLMVLGSCGGRATADDATLHQALAAGQSGAEVTFKGRVAGEPQRAGTHEHLNVSTSLGDRLEIDHNTGLAPWVPAHSGDTVTVHGQLYVDAPGRQGIHCTHSRTSRSCPQSGWIELRGSYYE